MKCQYSVLCLGNFAGVGFTWDDYDAWRLGGGVLASQFYESDRRGAKSLI